MKASPFISGLIGTLFTAFSSLAAAQTSVSVGPATPAAGLPSVTWLGSGCPADSDTSFHFEGNYLVLDFAKMVASKGEGISLIESRKTCSITVDLKIPNGLGYALGGYTAAGSDDLAETDSRTLTVSSFFQGQSQTGSVSEALNGPSAADFHSTHWNTAEETVWSPCNVDRAQTITVALRVGGTDRAAASTSTLDSIRLPLRLRLCAGGLR